MALLLNEYPYSDFQKINLDWVLDLANKLKADAASGEFDGARGYGIYGGNVMISQWTDGASTEPYAIAKSLVSGAGIGDFILGKYQGTAVIMPVVRENAAYLFGDTVVDITGPQGEQGPQGEPGEGGLTEAMKQALLQLARKVAYIDGNGQTYYNALYTAFYGGTPVVVLDSITAVFNQGSTVIYDTDTLDSLKPMLTVTAHYSDNTTATVPSTDYTLSGTLTEGTSTVTVTYEGLTATFSVNVTHADNTLYNWDFKTGLTDTKQGIVATTTATQTSGTGLVYDTMNQYTLITGISSLLKKTVEIDVVEIGNRVGGNHRRLFLFYGSNSGQQAGFVCRNGNTWTYYSGQAWDSDSIAEADASYFNGKTVKIDISDTGAITVSRKDIGAADSTYEQVYASSIGATTYVLTDTTHCAIGWDGSSDGLGNATISGMRIYG